MKTSTHKNDVSEPMAPTGLRCDLLRDPAETVITNPRPRFSWVMNSTVPGDVQTAWRILASRSRRDLDKDKGELWDSGMVRSGQSTGVPFGGKGLPRKGAWWWKVRTWDRRGRPGAYSQPQQVVVDLHGAEVVTARQKLVIAELPPVGLKRLGRGQWFVDFGKAAFATLKLRLTSSRRATVEVHLGERLLDGRVDRNPPGSVRYRKMELAVRPGTRWYRVAVTPDQRNTGEKAIKMPPGYPEVLPYRYAELVGVPGALKAGDVRQGAVHYPWREDASAFTCSSRLLTDIWDLCKYTMKATSFCGVYVDGDRERIPYEADAYLNQLSHYCADAEYTLARHSHEYLLTHPTWPTEWILHSLLMAWADYEYTGDSASLERHYATLKAKTLHELEGKDGLISSHGKLARRVKRGIHRDDIRDVVDWPSAGFKGAKTDPPVRGERDGYEMVAVNTAVNAFHARAMALMGRIAGVLGHKADARYFAAGARRVARTINAKLFDARRGVYVDGLGTSHASLHANMFPLAFDLVPPRRVAGVVKFIRRRGMACSVYGAQYLLEGLYRAGEGDYALSLMTARHDRSWRQMLRSGSTMTWEAWDMKYKRNQDWNHAWGAAPGNIIPRWLMGVQPAEAGCGRLRIMPQVGSLRTARLKLPTIRGPVEVAFRKAGRFVLEVCLPANVTADVYVPAPSPRADRLTVDGRPRLAPRVGDFLLARNIGSGRHRFLAEG